MNKMHNERHLSLAVDPIRGSTGFEVEWFHVVGKKMVQLGPSEFAYDGYKNFRKSKHLYDVKAVISTSMEFPACPSITKTVVFKAKRSWPRDVSPKICRDKLYLKYKKYRSGRIYLAWYETPKYADSYTIYTNNAGAAPAPTFRRLADSKGIVKQIKERHTQVFCPKGATCSFFVRANRNLNL